MPNAPTPAPETPLVSPNTFVTPPRDSNGYLYGYNGNPLITVGVSGVKLTGQVNNG